MNQPDPATDRNPLDSGQATAPTLDNPGVKIPPPFVVFPAILIGVAIDYFFPIRILPASLTSFTGWLGVALVLLATVTGPILSFREFRRARTPIGPDEPVSGLVTTGPFRYSRNPMYLSLLVMQLGAGIWLNNVWVVMLLAPVTAWVRWWAIAREERYLHGKFGQAYLAYQAKVRRWL